PPPPPPPCEVCGLYCCCCCEEMLPPFSEPLPCTGLDSPLSGAGVDGAVGIAGDVILSRASGNWPASAGGDEGFGVESIVSRYGSTSPYESGSGVCDCCPDGRDLRPRRNGRRRSLMQLGCG